MNPALYRPGTSDRSIWQNVVQGDEYKLPQMTSQDVCLDVGGNTGAAAYAMLQKGAGKVISFEPDPANFILFRKQMKNEIKEGRVEVYPLAVVGGSGFSWREFSGVVTTDGELNHGGAFLFSPDGSDHGYGKYMVNRPTRVPCVGIQQVLEMSPSWRLWKMDCEGSGFEITDSIFSNPKNERYPQTIVGEYHPFVGGNPAQLAVNLEMTHYTVKLQPHPNSDLGLFFAERK